MMKTSGASPSATTPAMPMTAVRKCSARAEPETRLADLGVCGTLVRLKTKDVVFSQGDPADTVFYLQKGQVKLTVVSNTGKEAVLGIVSDGQFVGITCLGGGRVRVKTATAMTDCELLRIDRDTMVRALHRDHALANLFLDGLVALNARMEADLADQLLNSSEKRLARALLLLARVGHDGTPATVALQVSQETLAEMVGTTRSRINTFMNKFRESGFVDYDKNGVHVHRSLLNVVLR